MKTFDISGHENILFVDMGYLMFYRIHATKRYFACRDVLEPKEEEFVPTFLHHLTQQLEKIKKKYNLSPEQMFFCCDVPQQTIWRMEIYPEYKGTRVYSDDLISKIWQKEESIYELIQKFGNVLRVPRLEADDLIALSIQQIRKTYPTKEIYIVSNDRDYLQLVDDKTHLMDGTLKEIHSKKNKEIDRWMKILTGDKSDNISPICKGCGPKTAEKLIEDKELLKKYIEKNQCQAMFDRNCKLISFDSIPETYQKDFQSNYNFV